ncbi:carbonic anhydrase [Streptantibioticus ferralitis]|uniref:carbonic anhydrase n=1 Tax=Streptantibioticus ferralitis TaxID=236510 RepID=A0ABT5Z4Y7_9ACTN|nr:carbonic anhydrase [Streptantibioticus ferralitis]MDF2258890.1 carbonic anhydrase [Streptantibioticus ferralitis]
MPSSNFTDHLQRNAQFAASDAKSEVPAIPFVPFQQLYLITCIDPRVEPAAVLGVTLGEAIVERNVGGRVTPSVIKDLAWICYLHEKKTPDADWFEVAVIHHTDCGSGLFADEDLRHGYAARGGHDEQTAAVMAVLDPAETVRHDVALLRAAPELAFSSYNFKIGGYSYDLKTGLVTTVVAPG